MKQLIIAIALMLSINSYSQNFGKGVSIGDLTQSLYLSNNDKVTFFMNRGFTWMKSTTGNIMLEKNQDVIPQYQRIEIMQDGNVDLISSDGSYSSYLITSYPTEKFTMERVGDNIVLYDKAAKIKFAFSTTIKTHIPYYGIYAHLDR